MALIVQHPRSFTQFDAPAPWLAQASTPGIAAPKLWVCTTCKLSLIVRARPSCFQCGQPMKVGKP